MIGKEKLVEVVGKSNVSLDAAVLDSYAKDLSFVNPLKPTCVVKPHTAEEIKRLVNLAKETVTPLVPVSSGPPHFRGDTVPGTGGAVIVDLSEMKKIIRVDRLNRVVMFEPGVTFGELIAAAAKEGLRLNVPLMPRQSKSVVGSLLEREPVILPKYHWDISDPLNCVEICFGTGEMFRTGAAAGPGSLEEQWAAGGAQVEAAGPSSASWYRVIQGSQGTMGIVSWASARCEILPQVEQPFLLGTNNLNDVIEMVHWLQRLRLVNECLVLNNTNLAAILAKKGSADYQTLKSSLPAWIIFFNIAGYDYFPEDRVRDQTKDMQDLAQRVGVEPRSVLGAVSASELLELVRNPSPEPYWKLRRKGACQDLFFITIYDKLPALVEFMQAEATKVGYPVSEIGLYLQPIVQGTNCHVEFNFFYDPANTKEAGLVKALTGGSSIKKLTAHGAFFSRPYGENALDILNADAATVTALRKVKSILDPENIMNPGKLCF
jgi:FAD/FMN-containing dehydrogenase